MTKSLILSACAAVLTGLAFTPASNADEFRVGVMAHDVEIAGLGGVREKERSEAITAEYIWDTPQWLDWAWGAKPYVYGSGNLAGNTSHAGAGVNWRGNFLESFYAEWGFGLSVHNGEIRVPNPADAIVDLAGSSNAEIRAEIERRFARKRDTIEFGSRALFRNQFVIGYELSDDWAAEIVYEHLSNGRVIGGPENEGLDNVGLRVARRF